VSDASILAAACLRAAIARADPVSAVERVLATRAVSGPCRIVAVGKAAHGMATGAVRWLASQGLAPASGVLIGHTDLASPHAALTGVAGDHPVPGRASLHASFDLGATVAAMQPDDSALVLLSGGASSLIAAPVAPLGNYDIGALTQALLASGAPIDISNTIRRRVFRWAGGRLAAAIGGQRIGIAISDVPGDHARLIGSGPLTGHRPEDDGFEDALQVLPTDMRGPLQRAWEAGLLNLPADEQHEVVIAASNAQALEAAAAVARQAGWQTETRPGALSGEAAAAGRSLAAELRALQPGMRQCIIAGGETTVTLRASPGIGGRSQELALAAARELHGVANVLLLAAGTDGRDGPTDAAGAVVDGATWARIPDGDGALRRHDAHRALAAAEALLRTGPTGTNVMDVVVALRW
jgi:hydroxypyruvate reductase